MISHVEPPFSEYEAQKGKPFIVDHYELGDFWDRTDMYSQAWKPEVDSINRYLSGQIAKWEVNNTVESVKKEIDRIEKLVNVKPEARASAKLALVAEYIKFMLQTENIKKESAKYGMI